MRREAGHQKSSEDGDHLEELLRVLVHAESVVHDRPGDEDVGSHSAALLVRQTDEKGGRDDEDDVLINNKTK